MSTLDQASLSAYFLYMQRYRIGIIGFGSIGKVHAWAYSALPYYYDPLPFEARIVAVATAHGQTAKAAARVCGAQRATTDFRELTEATDIDVVHICTPNNEHYEQLASAIEHGKQIYCDKPLVADWNQAMTLAPRFRDYSGKFGMAFQIRFFPVVKRAASLLADRRLGRVLCFRISYLHSGSADPLAPAKWKLTRQAGGGVIADLASHVVDLLASLGAEVTELDAKSSIAFATRPAADDPTLRVSVDAEDHMVALVRARFGEDQPALGSVEATKTASGTEDELRLEIHGSDGAIRLNTMKPHWLEFYDTKRPATPIGGERGWTHIDVGPRYPAPAAAFPGPKFTLGWERSHLASIAEYLFAVHEAREHQPGFFDGLYAQHLVDCLQRSATESTTVRPMPRSEMTAIVQGAAGASSEASDARKSR